MQGIETPAGHSPRDGATAETSCPIAPDPRTALVAHLAASIAALTAAGDLHGAQLAARTITELLTAPGGVPASVVDLAAERAKRER